MCTSITVKLSQDLLRKTRLEKINKTFFFSLFFHLKMLGYLNPSLFMRTSFEQAFKTARSSWLMTRTRPIRARTTLHYVSGAARRKSVPSLFFNHGIPWLCLRGTACGYCFSALTVSLPMRDTKSRHLLQFISSLLIERIAFPRKWVVSLRSLHERSSRCCESIVSIYYRFQLVGSMNRTNDMQVSLKDHAERHCRWATKSCNAWLPQFYFNEKNNS